jgi:hypothetical protein
MEDPTTKYSRLIPIFKELRELALKYDFIEHADGFTELIDLAQLESPDFERAILSGDVWGGAGALWELSFSGNVDGDPEELLADDLAYERLLLELIQHMKAIGIRNDRVDLLEGVFQR